MRFSPDAVFHGLGCTPDLAITIRLANKSKECYELSETEAGWNNFVHAPLLELARESAFAPSVVRIACLLVASFHFTSLLSVLVLFFFKWPCLLFSASLDAYHSCLLEMSSLPHISLLALLASCLFFNLLRPFIYSTTARIQPANLVPILDSGHSHPKKLVDFAIALTPTPATQAGKKYLECLLGAPFPSYNHTCQDTLVNHPIAVSIT